MELLLPSPDLFNANEHKLGIYIGFSNIIIIMIVNLAS